MDIENSSDEIKQLLHQNPLFNGFDERQINDVLKIIEIVTFESNDVLVNENEKNENIYIIKEGKVGIYKWDSHLKQNHQLAILEQSGIIGEMTLLDDSVGSATARALEKTKVLKISRNELYNKAKEKNFWNEITSQLAKLQNVIKKATDEPSFLPLIIQNLAMGLAQRVRTTNEIAIDAMRKELNKAKSQVAMGLVIINVLCMIAIYMYVLKSIEEMHLQVTNTILISVPMIILFTLGASYIIFKAGYPMEFYGMTLKNWWPALKESILVTLVMVLITILAKYILIHTPILSPRPLFDGEFWVRKFTIPVEIIIVTVYVLFVPLQELVVRGLLQSSFQEFLTGKNRILLAIFLSNLLFSLTHFHFPLVDTLVVFVTGLAWGWLYSRNQTLIGPIFSHLFIGIWGLFFLGI